MRSPSDHNAVSAQTRPHARNYSPMRLTERRRHPRIYSPMPLTVGVGDLEFETVVKDLSAGGLCSRLPIQIRTGQALHLVVQFCLFGTQPRLGPTMFAEGIVTRVRALGDGTYEFAAKFTIHHLFAARESRPTGSGKRRR